MFCTTTTPSTHPANDGALIYFHQQGLNAHFLSYFTLEEKFEKVVHIYHCIYRIGPVYKPALRHQASALSVSSVLESPPCLSSGLSPFFPSYFKMHNLLAFRTFPVLYNNHSSLVPEHFHHSKENHC